MASELAVLGGKKAVYSDVANMFDWPIVTPEVEAAVLDVLRTGRMSGTDVTKQFEKEYAEWLGAKYALAHNTGTAAIHGAFFGLGIGKGDEVICPSITYWASCAQVLNLGGRVVFCDVEPDTLDIDPKKIEALITPRTKAIVAVHYLGYPADMDAIMAVARKHNLKVLEDVSHAHGGLYKGRMVGTMGDVAGFSLMTGKSFATGEGGIMTTNDPYIYERAIVFGHYERHGELTYPDLVAGAGLPWGGYKYRMHQLTSAMGRVQIKKYPAEMAEIDKAMNYFWDLLEGVPGIKAHRPPKGSGKTMGGWYAAHGLYRPEELGGLSVTRFCQAVAAEGVPTGPGCNKALHLHPLFNSLDVYKDGRPTNVVNLPEGVTVKPQSGTLPVAEGIQERCFGIPWFKHYRPEIIEQHAEAIKKVVRNFEELLADDPGNPKDGGAWFTSRRRGA